MQCLLIRWSFIDEIFRRAPMVYVSLLCAKSFRKRIAFRFIIKVLIFMTRNKFRNGIFKFYWKFRREYGTAPTAYGFIGAFSILMFSFFAFPLCPTHSPVLLKIYFLWFCAISKFYREFVQIEWKLHSCANIVLRANDEFCSKQLRISCRSRDEHAINQGLFMQHHLLYLKLFIVLEGCTPKVSFHIYRSRFIMITGF